MNHSKLITNAKKCIAVIALVVAWLVPSTAQAAESEQLVFEHDVVRYGDIISFEAFKDPKAPLHGHDQNYQDTDRQQVVGLKDDQSSAKKRKNNWWLIMPEYGKDVSKLLGRPIRQGTTIRLRHLMTKKFLHSSNEFTSPKSLGQQVFCFGEQGTDGNWTIILDADRSKAVWNIEDRFVLFHKPTSSNQDIEQTSGKKFLTLFPETSQDIGDQYIIAAADAPYSWKLTQFHPETINNRPMIEKLERTRRIKRATQLAKDADAEEKKELQDNLQEALEELAEAKKDREKMAEKAQAAEDELANQIKKTEETKKEYIKIQETLRDLTKLSQDALAEQNQKLDDALKAQKEAEQALEQQEDATDDEVAALKQKLKDALKAQENAQKTIAEIQADAEKAKDIKNQEADKALAEKEKALQETIKAKEKLEKEKALTKAIIEKERIEIVEIAEQERYENLVKEVYPLIAEQDRNEMTERSVKYGDKIYIKFAYGNIQLHSIYGLGYNELEDDSGNQQVMGYTGKTGNSVFVVKTAHGQGAGSGEVKHGDIIRLEHFNSEKNLHADKESTSPAGFGGEVSCFGKNGRGDEGDNFMIMIAQNGNPNNPAPLGTPLKSNHTFMLAHVSSSENTKSSTVDGKEFVCPILNRQFDIYRVHDITDNDSDFHFVIALSPSECHWFVNGFHDSTTTTAKESPKVAQKRVLSSTSHEEEDDDDQTRVGRRQDLTDRRKTRGRYKRKKRAPASRHKREYKRYRVAPKGQKRRGPLGSKKERRQVERSERG